MTSFASSLLVAALCVVAAASVVVDVAPAMPSIQAVRQVMADGPGKMPRSVSCVSRAEIRKRSRSSSAVGLTITTNGKSTVLLDWRRVCLPLGRYFSGRNVEPARVVGALVVVMHEKAHVNGIHVEWQAECAAIPAALKQLQRWGYSARQVAGLKRVLLEILDRGQSNEYKLRGRCRV